MNERNPNPPNPFPPGTELELRAQLDQLDKLLAQWQVAKDAGFPVDDKILRTQKLKADYQQVFQVYYGQPALG
jgi:hypothetical protein